MPTRRHQTQNQSSQKTAIAGDNSSTWVVRSLGLSFANREVSIAMEKSGMSDEDCGVRQVGSTDDLFFTIGRGQVVREVIVDASGDIEIYSTNNGVSFYLIGVR